MQLADIYLWFVYLVSRLFDMLIQKMAPLSLIFEHLSSNNCTLYKTTEVILNKSYLVYLKCR